MRVTIFELLIELLTDGFVVGSILNQSLSRYLKVDKKSLQNLISLSLVVGLIFSYILLFASVVSSWYSAVDSEQYVFIDPLNGPYGGIYISMMLMPILVIILNLKKSLRTNHQVIVISSLLFLPRLYELFIALTSSDSVNLFNINYVYSDPAKDMLFFGVVIYIFSLATIKIKSKRLKKQENKS